VKKVSQNTSIEGFFPATSMADEDWWSALWPDPQGVLRRIGLKKGMRAADLCCGYGWFTGAMARIAGAGRVTAVDIDPEMIEMARAHLAQEGAPEVTWQAADACATDACLDEPADFILIANAFHGAPDKTALAACCARCMRPGGLLAIINWHALPREKTKVLDIPRGPAEHLRMTPQDTRAAVEPAGFAFVRTHITTRPFSPARTADQAACAA